VGTDHGGKGTHHGSDSPEERLVPYIFYGKNIKQGYEIKTQDIKITDMTATIAFLFGLKQPDSWLGLPIREITNP
jgi:phosphopentomutase